MRDLSQRFGETYPSAFRSAGIGGPYFSAFKALGQASFHKGTERPVPALLKALGQVILHTEMERLVPALLNALGQVILIRE